MQPRASFLMASARVNLRRDLVTMIPTRVLRCPPLAVVNNHTVRRTGRKSAPPAPFLRLSLWVIVVLVAARASGELVLLPATNMTGVAQWKQNQSWGAGPFFSTDGSALSQTVEFQGGEYQVYVRMFTSSTTDADLIIRVAGKRLPVPMQANVGKLAWLRLGVVTLPKGTVDIRVEPPQPGTASSHNLATLAFCSTPLEDRVGRVIAFSDWLRQELTRLEAPKPAPRTATEARERQREFRSQLLDVLGLNPLPPRTPLNPRVTARLDRDAYVIEKVAYESRPNHVVPALLYLPKNTTGPVPAVISAIGHWSSGKSSKKPQLRAIALARHGYAVLALDPAYAWERGIPGNSEGFEPFVAGGAIAGHMAWDIMRGADYLETRSEIDATRLGVTGASGGGLQTFYAGAVDERFDAVMPAVALWSMPELALNFYYSSDNWVPGISRLGGMGGLIALTAPRAMLVMNMDADFCTSYACEQMVNAARPHYRLLGTEDKILHTIGKGPHDYTREMREVTCAFVDRWLKQIGDGFPVPEADIEKDLFNEKDPALLVFEGGKISTNGAETVQTFWTAQATALRDALPENPQGLAAKLHDDLLRMPPLGVPNVVESGDGLLVTTDPGVQVAVRRLGSGHHAVIWVGERDFATEVQRKEVKNLATQATVFVLEPRGVATPDDLHILRHATIVMGRPLSGQWTYDVLCLVDHLARQRQFQSIRVAGRGLEMGLVCLLATLFDERIEAAGVEGMFSSFVQLVGHGNPASQIPGILRVADVAHIVNAAGTNRIQMNNLQRSKGAAKISSTAKRPPEFSLDWVKGEHRP